VSEQLFLIAKADRKYRASIAQNINPRSKTEVREGSGLRRTARWGGGLVGGTVGGGVLGSVAGRGLRMGPSGQQALAGIGSTIGGSAGVSVGRSANLKSGDTRARNRRTGKRAKGNTTVGWGAPGNLGSYWNYN
jgi:uncharacterized protein YcfJ